MISSTDFTQNKKVPPCYSKEAHQFDFWLGNWDLHWFTSEGKTAYGKNNVKKILGSCVINENFSTNGEKPFVGKSYSVYNSKMKFWEQTWVDNSGGYIIFSGKFKKGKMTFTRKFKGKEDKEIIQRMVFYNISKNNLDWDWESSNDKGKTWKLNWRIHYKRHIGS